MRRLAFLSAVALSLSACGPTFLGTIEMEIDPEVPRADQNITVHAAVQQWFDTLTITASHDGEATTYTGDDLTEDDSPEVGSIYSFVIPAEDTAKGQTWTFEAVASAGRGELRGDLELQIGNTLPSGTVELTPEMPTRADAIVAIPSFEDADGDEVTLRYEWTVDRDPVEVEGPELPAGSAARNQVVRLSVYGHDGDEEGEPATAEITVRNSKPVVSVTLVPEVPNTTDALVATAVGEDADEDDLTYEYSWEINDEQLTTTAEDLPEVLHTRDDVVRVRVVARDGRTISEPAFAEVTIQNSPPTAPEVQLGTEETMSSFADLYCDVIVPSTDADRDPITYNFQWYRNGMLWEGRTSTTLFAGDTVGWDMTEEDDSWSCTATATDGEHVSAEASSETVDIVAILEYRVKLGQLVNQPSDCGSGNRYANSSNYGFYWNDEGAVRPSSFTVEYQMGVNCEAGNRTAYLNGTSVGTVATSDSNQCTCTPRKFVRKYTFDAPASYRAGGRNEFTLSRRTSEGMSSNPDWRADGADVWAIVSVMY